jgi:hypothetical protein
MFKSRLLATILGLFFSFVTLAADNSIDNDGQNIKLNGKTYSARVTAAKAIVYADENMLTPLGYISNSKIILVGNPRRINKDLVPIVVYGRIAFIEIRDIRYEDSEAEENSTITGAPREHDVDITIQRPDEKLSENNSIYFNLHTFGAGNEVQKVISDIDGVNKSSFTGFGTQIIHRAEASRFFYGGALDYSSISSTSIKFSFWTISPTIGFTPMRNRLFLLDVYGSFDIAFNTVLEITSNFEKEPPAIIFGPSINSRIVLFPESKYHLVGGIGIRKYQVNDLESLTDSNGNRIAGIKDITGINLFLGLGLEFY